MIPINKIFGSTPTVNRFINNIVCRSTKINKVCNRTVKI